jgi:hypothetical protein
VVPSTSSYRVRAYTDPSWAQAVGKGADEEGKVLASMLRVVHERPSSSTQGLRSIRKLWCELKDPKYTDITRKMESMQYVPTHYPLVQEYRSVKEMIDLRYHQSAELLLMHEMLTTLGFSNLFDCETDVKITPEKKEELAVRLGELCFRVSVVRGSKRRVKDSFAAAQQLLRKKLQVCPKPWDKDGGVEATRPDRCDHNYRLVPTPQACLWGTARFSQLQDARHFCQAVSSNMPPRNVTPHDSNTTKSVRSTEERLLGVHRRWGETVPGRKKRLGVVDIDRLLQQQPWTGDEKWRAEETAAEETAAEETAAEESTPPSSRKRPRSPERPIVVTGTNATVNINIGR